MRETLVRQSSAEVRENLKTVVNAFDDLLDEWLAGPEADQRIAVGRVHCIFRDEDGCGLRVCVGQCIGSGGSRCSVFMTNLRGLLASKDVRQKRPCYTIGGGCNPITACDHWWYILWLFLYPQ